jgi:cytochrome c-type biogenesis protein CcmH
MWVRADGDALLTIVVVLMTAAAIFAVLWPLGRRRAVAAGSDLAVYTDQLDEIERDRAAGRIGKAEAEAARLEVSRRLLAADTASAARAGGETTPESARAALWRRRVASVVALVALPVGSASLYLALGSPTLPGAPLAERLAAPPEQRSVATLVAQVEAHLARNPEDGRGWEVLAPVSMRMGRFDEAVKARQAALRLLGATADREADLGEALVAAANGVVTAEAKHGFEDALALDSQHTKARFFIGLAAEQDGRRGEAAAAWRGLLADAPAGAAWTEFVKEALARVDDSAASRAPGPSGDDIAAAESLSPQQRAEMIRGMVERLADRLKQDGSDLEGWLRLVRAYSVIGERDKARAAAADARRALGGDSEKIRQIDEFVKGLGLGG